MSTLYWYDNDSPNKTTSTAKAVSYNPQKGEIVADGEIIDFNFIPDNAPAETHYIMGIPSGAKFLISYAYKKDPSDPVVFCRSKKEMKKELKKIMKDSKIDKRTILIHQISKRFKPKKLLVWLKLKEI